jgi:hypothetical protein
METGAWRGDHLDLGKYYHIINDYIMAAAARKQGGWKTSGSREAGGTPGRIFQKNIDNLSTASYTYKVKIWAVLA